MRTAVLWTFALAGALALPADAAPGRVKGAVLASPDGGPVIGAIVSLVSDEAVRSYVTSTDADGQFDLRPVAAGLYDLRVEASGFFSDVKTAIRVRPPFRNVIEVTLVPGIEPTRAAVEATDSESRAELRGRVIARDGEPVPDALVTLTPRGGQGVRNRRLSDADGDVAVDELAPGPYRLRVNAPGLVTLVVDPFVVPDQPEAELTLVMVPFPVAFRGQVEDLLPHEEPLVPERLRTLLTASEARLVLPR